MQEEQKSTEQVVESTAQETTSTPMTKKKSFWGILAIALIFSFTGVAVTASETYHKDRIFHGVWIGPLDIGGLKRTEAKEILGTWHDQWWSSELSYNVLDEQGKPLTSLNFYPILVSESASQSIEYIQFDLDAMLFQAYQYGRDPSLVKRLLNQLALLSKKKTIPAIVEIDKEQLEEILVSELEEYQTLPVNASFELSRSGEPVLISESQGNTFNFDQAIATTESSLIAMETSSIKLVRTVTDPEVYSSDVQVALEQLDAYKSLFPIDVTYHDPRIDFARDWKLKFSAIQEALHVDTTDANEAVIALDATKLDGVYSVYESVINVDPNNAKFAIDENGKVEQFEPSQKGYVFDRDATTIALNAWTNNLLTKNEAVESTEDITDASEDTEKETYEDQAEPEAFKLVVNELEPTVSTADVNDLGITEVLGVGYSNFSGSPRNRVHNISIGINKLNGLLIAPGEDFSLVQALKPFTISEGYLPELVIKGDKIEPEVGGGLCQIGSTTFRAAMKSGLPIVERRNHSLVVNYYNDPRNGNPGTDATIYDSSPDFKFKNDTGNYILIETEMNRTNGDLFFTFWGTSDGREGDYTEPVVSRWIGTGPTKYIETEDLAPGEQKCQGAHVGAEASFTYSVKRPDGTLDEELFTSSYRPLPTICLVGVDPNAEAEESGDGEEGSDEEVAESAIAEPVSENSSTEASE